MNYRLIALDLDGTLLNDEKKISETDAAAVRRAAEAGYIVMIATGRPYRAASWVFDQIGVKKGLILAHSGSAIYRYPGEEKLWSGGFDEAFLSDLLAFSKEHQVYFHCNVGSEYFFVAEGEMADLTEVYLGYRGIVTEEARIVSLPAEKATVLLPAERTDGITAALTERFAGRATPVKGCPDVIDITPYGIDKATALIHAAELLNIPIEETVAVGDSANDVPIIRAAGLGVCMANGVPEALEAADVVAPSNNENGVAHVIGKYLFGEE